MRFTSALVFSASCWSFQSVSASTAHVYTHDPPSRPRPDVQSRSLSPVEARLVFAQRAGVEDFHASDLANGDVIRAINDFGVRTPLLADEKIEDKRAFMLLEGETSIAASIPSLRSSSSFQLDPAPDAASSLNLFVDLARQSDPSNFLRLSDADLTSLFSDHQVVTSNGDLFYIAKTAPDADAFITRLLERKEWSLTTLIAPRHAAGSKSFDWGTYTMPKTSSVLHKRQSSEAPLTFAAVESSTSAFSAPVNAFQDNDDTSPAPSSSPFAGIVPACYSSQSACETQTRNCTGHGACALKYHDADLKQSCFACACSPSKSADGLRTTYWGGPACQKKDISVEFWLISLFTVGLVGLIGFAIGSVWEMGSEPLPSVIGAGVSGTGVRK